MLVALVVLAAPAAGCCSSDVNDANRALWLDDGPCDETVPGSTPTKNDFTGAGCIEPDAQVTAGDCEPVCRAALLPDEEHVSCSVETYGSRPVVLCVATYVYESCKEVGGP